MTPFTVVMVSLWLLTTLVAAVALVYAIRAHSRPLKHSQSMTAIRAEFTELMDDVEKLTHLVAKKANREQMRDTRAKNGADPYGLRKGETAAEWKARMRAGVSSGEIKPPRFTG